MSRPHTSTFRFSINDLAPAHRIQYTKKIDKMDMFLRLIEAYRFTLEQDSFDLIRLSYSDYLIIIRRLRFGSKDFEFYVKYAPVANCPRL